MAPLGQLTCCLLVPGGLHCHVPCPMSYLFYFLFGNLCLDFLLLVFKSSVLDLESVMGVVNATLHLLFTSLFAYTLTIPLCPWMASPGRQGLTTVQTQCPPVPGACSKFLVPTYPEAPPTQIKGTGSVGGPALSSTSEHLSPPGVKAPSLLCKGKGTLVHGR